LAAGFALSTCTHTYTHIHSCFLLGTHITTMSLFLSGLASFCHQRFKPF